MGEKLSIIGSGVVGYATGTGFIKKGYDVTFIDIDAKRVQYLREKGLTAYTPNELKENNVFDISFLSVSTPTVNDSISLDYLHAASIELGKRIANYKNYHLIVVRSTVPPGTTRNLVIKTIEKYSGKKVGKDFGVCMNPEYLRELSAEKDFLNPWLILIGQYDTKSGKILKKLYTKFKAPISIVNLEEAEIEKYIHNIYNAVKIAFFNEFRDISESLGLDTQKVFELVSKSSEGMWNPQYGIRDYGPFNGSCLPKDTEAFLSYAKHKGYDLKILKAAIKSNKELLEFENTEEREAEKIREDSENESS